MVHPAISIPSLLKRGALALLVLMAGEAFAPIPAMAADPACDGVDTALTDSRKQEYAALVAGALENAVEPSAVTISSFMASGAWSAVYAATPVADDGVLFFEDAGGEKQFKDVWGGMALPEDRPELIAFATELGAPESLAKCFAHIVID